MTDLFAWLLSDSLISVVVAAGLGLLLLTIIVLYVVSFIQGREISFWPPKVSSKPETARTSQKQISHAALKNSDPAHVGPKLLPTETRSWTLGEDLFAEFSGWSSCNSAIVEKIKTSNEVRIMKIKGRDLYKELAFRNAIMERTEKRKFTRVLLQAPYSSYIDETISREFKWKSLDSYLQDLQNSLQILSDTISSPNEIIRLYTFPTLLKVYIFDDEVFVSSYTGSIESQTHKEDVNVWSLSISKDPTGLAQFIKRYFDALWDESQPLHRIINKTVIYDQQTGSLILPVPDSVSAYFSRQPVKLRNHEFSPKEELHITIIGPERGQKVRERLKSPDKHNLFLKAIAETNWCYELKDDLYCMAKDKPVVLNKTRKVVHAESVIQLVNVPELEGFYRRIQAISGVEMPPRLAHITLFVCGDKEGIGVDDQTEFDEFNRGRVSPEELRFI